MCLVAKPLNRSEARVDFVVIQTLLLFIFRSPCYHANMLDHQLNVEVVVLFEYEG